MENILSVTIMSNADLDRFYRQIKKCFIKQIEKGYVTVGKIYNDENEFYKGYEVDFDLDHCMPVIIPVYYGDRVNNTIVGGDIKIKIQHKQEPTTNKVTSRFIRKYATMLKYFLLENEDLDEKRIQILSPTEGTNNITLFFTHDSVHIPEFYPLMKYDQESFSELLSGFNFY